MTQMLRHKVTGELFVYTPQLAALDELELVKEDPVEKALRDVDVTINKVVASFETVAPVLVVAPPADAAEPAKAAETPRKSKSILRRKG